MNSTAAVFSQRLLKVESVYRRVLIREQLDSLSAPELVEHLHELLLLTLRGGEREVWYAVADALLNHPLASGRVPDVYRAAVDGGHDLVRRLFLGGDAVRCDPGSAHFDPESLLDELSLGERRALARQHDRRILERLLLADSDVVVLKHMLANPSMTEALILKLASRRPNRASVLLELACTRRWSCCAQVREALIQNPYAPLKVGLYFSPLLNTARCRRLAHDTQVHPGLREFARQLLHQRRPPGRDEVYHLDALEPADDEAEALSSLAMPMADSEPNTSSA